MADKEVNTEGGSVVEGDVETGGGNFVGRDRITNTTHHENTSHTNLSGNTIVTVLAVLIVGAIAALLIFRVTLPGPSPIQTAGVVTTISRPITNEPEQLTVPSGVVPENTAAAIEDTPTNISVIHTDTPEPVATDTPTPTDTPVAIVPAANPTRQCNVGESFTVSYQSALGCGIGSVEVNTITIEKFENGYLMWNKTESEAGLKQIYVLLSANSQWFIRPDEYEDGISPPSACPEAERWPRMGFGIVWCNNQELFGVPLAEEIPDPGAQRQLFENGQMIRYQNQTFILFGKQGGQWTTR